MNDVLQFLLGLIIGLIILARCEHCAVCHGLAGQAETFISKGDYLGKLRLAFA